MRSDFINKRFISNKRLLSQTNFTDTEIIVIPEFDTFYYHNPPSAFGDDRWAGTVVLPNSGNLEEATQIPIGLLNPWNDGADMQGEFGGLSTVYQVRTPTRTAMAFNLSSLPPNAQITDAKLKLTVSSKRDWD
jgi:hypothetical protein